MTPKENKKRHSPCNYSVLSGGSGGSRTQCINILDCTVLYSVTEFAMPLSVFNMLEFEIVTPKGHQNPPKLKF